MILIGAKGEEYRDVKPSMISKFFNWQKLCDTREEFIDRMLSKDEKCWEHMKRFDTITFSNGYATNRDQMVVVAKFLRMDNNGNHQWGATPGKNYLIITLGEIRAKRIDGNLLTKPSQTFQESLIRM